MIDEILDKFGLKFEDLSPQEIETLNSWLDALQKGELTMEKIKEYVLAMKTAVSSEISLEPSFIRIFIFKVTNPRLSLLQARLRNYILLESFLSTPEKAKKEMENALGRIAKKT